MKSGTSKAKPSRPVEVRATRTRNLILKAALDSILSGGLQGFTANELMRRTGLSKGALFHHFQSLDDIAIECAQLSGHLVRVEVKGNLKETLEHFMAPTYAYRRARALSALLFFLCERARLVPRFRKVMHLVNKERVHLVTHAIRAHCPELSAEKLDELAALVHTSHMGLAGPAGECMGGPERSGTWASFVEKAVKMAQA